MNRMEIEQLNQQVIKASQLGRYDKVLELLKKLGTNFNPAAIDEEGRGALHYTGMFNQLRIAKILLDHGANLEFSDCEGKTPVDWAWGETKNFFLNINLTKPPLSGKERR